VRQAVCRARGYFVTGALGGAVSSTAVTLAYARLSKTQSEDAVPLAAGAVAASTVLIPRIAVVTAVLNAAFAPSAMLAIAPMFVAGALILVVVARSQWGVKPRHGADDGANPLELWAALRMAIAFQVVVFGVEYAKHAFGSQGVMATAALAGLTDMDALTLTMSRLAADPSMMRTAAQALTIGVIANSVLKTGLAVAFGSPAYWRRVGGALLTMAAVGGATLRLGG